MRTVKWNPFLSGGCAVLGGMLLWAGAARADVSSTNAAAIVVFPKIVVDTGEADGVMKTEGYRTDTIIQLSNTSSDPVNVRCFLVNANGHCSNSGRICDPNGDPAYSSCDQFEFCEPGWQESDFRFRLTPKQPIVWTVSDGLLDLPLAQFNDGSILPAPESPMMGELKCVEVDDSELPVDRNDLKGEATIETVELYDGEASVDSRGYNAIGIQAIEGANNGDNTLVLGEEYNACPNILILDHFFDDAVEPSEVYDTVRTHLTLVPCSEDFNFQAPITTTVQYLVFNEFEQRFSTSRPVTCFSEIVLSDIDTQLGPTGDAQSLFNVNVQGTLTGQTLIRGVADSSETYGHGLLAVAEEFHCKHAADNSGTVNPDCGVQDRVVYGNYVHSDAYVPQQRGTRTQLDYVQLPLPQPPSP